MHSRRQPLVSVVVPVFNGSACAARCVASLKRQSHPCVEFVFVDDASTDGTPGLLERACSGDERFRILRSDVHAGAFPCRKRGFEASRGDIVMFLDADDELEPEACRTVARTMGRTGVDMFVYGSTAVGAPHVPPTALSVEQRVLDRQPFSGRMDRFDKRRELLASPKRWACPPWNKALRRAVLERALSSYEPPRSTSYGEDAVQAFLVCMSVRSVWSDTGTRLHRHSVGTDVRGAGRGGPERERLERTLGSAGAAAAELERCIALRAGELGRLAPKIEKAWVSSLLDVSAGFLARLPRERIPEGTDLMVRSWGFRAFAAPLFATPAMDAILPEMLGASCLEGRREPVRTIAMYYPVLGLGGIHGGLHRCLQLLSGFFLREGFAVKIVTDRPLPPGERKGFPPGAAFDSLFPDAEGEPPERVGARCERWERFLRDSRADMVYYGAFQHPDLLSDLLCIRASGAFAVVHTHQLFCRPLSAWGARRFAHRLRGFALADALVVLSREGEAFFRAFGLPARYFPNPPSFPADPGGPCRPREKAGFRRMVWCSRIAPEKHPVETIRIFSVVRRALSDVRLAVVGDCIPAVEPLKRAMKDEAKALGCADAIDWVGFVDDVRPWLDSSDLFLSTSCVEGFPMSVFEALSRGLPGVAYELPCVEPMKSPAAVRSVPQGDFEAAAAEAIRLLTDDASYAAASAAAVAEFEKFAAFDQQRAWGDLVRSLPAARKARTTPAEGTDPVWTDILRSVLDHAALAEANQERRHRRQAAAAKQKYRAKLEAARGGFWSSLAAAARKRLGRVLPRLRS